MGLVPAAVPSSSSPVFLLITSHFVLLCIHRYIHCCDSIQSKVLILIKDPSNSCWESLQRIFRCFIFARALLQVVSLMDRLYWTNVVVQRVLNAGGSVPCPGLSYRLKRWKFLDILSSSPAPLYSPGDDWITAVPRFPLPVF